MEDKIEIRIVTPKNENCHCIVCPYCGAHEIKNCEEKDVDKWIWQIKAFKVDDSSHCLKCDKWFELDV